MKKINLWLTAILCMTLSTALFARAKYYEIKSGIVEYKVEGGGNILGFSTKTTGNTKLYFTDWGNIQLREEHSKEISMGKAKTEHHITKIEHGTVYIVNEREKVIIKNDIAMLKNMDKQGKNMSAIGKDMMKEMGGKKIGTGKVLGYPCEIWEVMGSKTWIYKGVPLKSEANIMGFKHLEVATSAKFNIEVPDSKFKLPNYPVKTMDAMIEGKMQNAQDEPTQKHIPAPQQPSPEQMKQMQDMLQNLGKMFGK